MKRKLHIIIILTLSFAALILSQVECLGATYYIDAVNGNDSNPGTSDAPWKTIDKAFNTATYGDTVLIRDGNYGAFNYTSSSDFPLYTGSMTEPLPSNMQFITFKADAGHEPVFTTIILGNTSNNYYVPYIFEGIRIESAAGEHGATFLGCVGPRIKNCVMVSQDLMTGYGVELPYERPSNDIRIEDCTIHTWDRGIHGYGSNLVISGNEIYNIGEDHMTLASGSGSGHNILIENNHIHHTNKVDPIAHPDGIAFVGLTNVVIRNNIIHDLQGQGIFDHDASIMLGSKNVLIENNLMYNVAVTELQFDTYSTAENWTMRNNTIIGASIVQQVSFGGGTNHNVYNNIFVCSYGVLDGAIDYRDYNIYVKKYTSNSGDTEPHSYGYEYLGDWESTHAAIEPELFVDPANKDFRLKAACRAVDFGDPNNYPTTDLLGNPRDAYPDAGCYEYVPEQEDEDDSDFEDLPDKPELKCYNNVFKPLKGERALIWVELSRPARVKVDLYNTRGNRIRKLVDKEEDAGTWRYYWDGKDDSGNFVGSGLYFVHIQAGDYKKTKKIVVVK